MFIDCGGGSELVRQLGVGGGYVEEDVRSRAKRGECLKVSRRFGDKLGEFIS